MFDRRLGAAALFETVSNMPVCRNFCSRAPVGAQSAAVGAGSWPTQALPRNGRPRHESGRLFSLFGSASVPWGQTRPP